MTCILMDLCFLLLHIGTFYGRLSVYRRHCTTLKKKIPYNNISTVAQCLSLHYIYFLDIFQGCWTPRSEVGFQGYILPLYTKQNKMGWNPIWWSILLWCTKLFLQKTPLRKALYENRYIRKMHQRIHNIFMY